MYYLCNPQVAIKRLETAFIKPSLCNSIISEGEPIKLPDNLESLPRAEHFPIQRHRWNTNEVNYNKLGYTINIFE